MLVKGCISFLLNVWLLNGAYSQKLDNNVLIVYLSRTNNTKVVAEIIQQKVGGDLIALELKTPYPEDYRTTVDQVAKENETGYLPPLKTEVDLSKYDVVFLEFPTWGMQLPPPIKSFLHYNNFANKTVIPFNTHAGYGVGNGFNTVKSMCPNATVLDGISLEGRARTQRHLLSNQKRESQRS